jgi:D-cysteine desulfhydrase
MIITFPESLNFSNLPTPIVPLQSDWTAKTGTRIWIKRDDLTGMEISGNKVRKLDFILKDALWQQATHILTCGGIQSNHCRTTAFMASRLGLKPVLFLKGEQEAIPTGNLLLNRLLQPEIIPVTAEEYQQIDSRMSVKSEEIAQQGGKGYCIPEGGSNRIGVWGYIRCFEEIRSQLEQQSLPVDSIMVATGSGGTHAGLLLGKILGDSPLKVFSINVCDNADYFKRKIFNIISEFESHYGYTFNLTESDITLFDGFVGCGYGQIGPEEVSIIREVAIQEGMVLDPVYTAKAFLGLKNLIKNGVIQSKNILFIHTGGIFGIFPHAAKFI